MKEYDERQFDLMIQKINAFNVEHLYLHDLIYDLEALLNVLTNKDKEWEYLFRGYWGDLEQVYAIALADERSHLDSEDQKIIDAAIENLKKLIYLKLQ